MGIIQRQSLKYSFISYIGVAIGIFSQLFIYTYVTDLIGTYKIIESLALFASTIFSIGLTGVSIRFLPKFKDEKSGHHGFLPFLLIFGIVGFLVFLLFFPLYHYFINEFWYINEKEVQGLSLLLIPLCFLFIYKNIFKSYISGFQRIVIPNLIDDLLTKISIPILCLLFIKEVLGYKGFGYGLILHYSVVLTLLVYYTIYLKQLYLKTEWSFFKKTLQKEIKNYAAFNVFNSLAAQLAFRIDIIMLGIFAGTSSTGIYSILSIMTQVIKKPFQAISAIAGPIISENWKSNNLSEIASIYKKSSTNLFLIGSYIFLGIWISIDDLLHIMPNTDVMSEGKYVVLFTGLYILIDMATSVNSHIIAYSKYYRFNLYALICLATLNIVLNYIFITKFDLTGAALATLCSNFIFNLLKVGFIYKKFKIQPFTKSTIKILVLVLISYVLCINIPLTESLILNICIRSVLLTILYGGITYFWKISLDANQLVDSFLEKAKGKFYK